MEVELKWHLMCRTCLTQFLDQVNLTLVFVNEIKAIFTIQLFSAKSKTLVRFESICS